MHIRTVDVFVLKLPHEESYLGRPPPGWWSAHEDGYFVRPPWRSLYASRFETLLVKVTSDDGTAGWGEALAPVAPEVPAEIVRRLLVPQLIGASATQPRPLWRRLRELMRERGHLVGHQADALAAVDIAVWDLAGRLAGRPVAALLGGAARAEIPVYVSGLPSPDDTGRARLAREWQAGGARMVKLHLGHGVEADLATVEAVRQAAPGLGIAVDAHWVYRHTDALRLSRGLAEREVAFLEAPLAPEDLAGHRQLAARAELPVAVGEMLRNRFEFRSWLETGALGLAQPDVARTGLTEAWSIGELAAAHHVPVAPHHSVALGPALAAGLHLAAALEDCPFFEYQPTTVEVAKRVLHSSLTGGPAEFTLPADGPGLGIEIDEDTVRAASQ